MALEGLGCRSVLENCVALAGPGVERERKVKIGVDANCNGYQTQGKPGKH